MTEWIQKNWGLLLVVLPLAIAGVNIVNGALDHWSSLTGSWWRRVPLVALFVLTELLSVVQSRNSPGRWKWPLTSVPPSKVLDRAARVTK